MRDPRVERWEARLRTIFDRIDDHLEDTYGGLFPLHPARARRGTTASKESDGLFEVGAAFSAGYGSSHGPGYVLEVRMVTLTHVPRDLREQITQEVVTLLREQLPIEFPEQDLEVHREGSIYRICGDLSIDKV